MAYIPKDAKWYLADIVLEINQEDTNENVVHINTILISADSPQEAYDKAMILGQKEAISYKNIEGKLINITFHGLQDLALIYDELEDGAEIFYTEKHNISKEEISSYIQNQNELSVFAPIQSSTAEINYSSGEIEKALLENLPTP